MSLRELARAYLNSQSDGQCRQLSQRDTPRGVPVGQTSSIPYIPGLPAVPPMRDSGTAKQNAKFVTSQLTPTGSGTVGTAGTLGTIGTLGTSHWEALQAEADRRNTIAKQERRTDRYCRCGGLSECAWPIDGRREVWRCFSCLPIMGSG